jgi:hypothetical protein
VHLGHVREQKVRFVLVVSHAPSPCCECNAIQPRRWLFNGRNPLLVALLGKGAPTTRNARPREILYFRPFPRLTFPAGGSTWCSYFRALGFTPAEFDVVCWVTGWANCAGHAGRADDTTAAAEEGAVEASKGEAGEVDEHGAYMMERVVPRAQVSHRHTAPVRVWLSPDVDSLPGGMFGSAGVPTLPAGYTGDGLTGRLWNTASRLTAAPLTHLMRAIDLYPGYMYPLAERASLLRSGTCWATAPSGCWTPGACAGCSRGARTRSSCGSSTPPCRRRTACCSPPWRAD